MKMRIIETTDHLFIGKTFESDEPIILNGAVFIPDEVTDNGSGTYRFSNSNYVLVAVTDPDATGAEA